MAEKIARSKKTEALTLRLDPKMKFQIELLSRLWHQSITGVIESAVHRAGSNIQVKTDHGGEESLNVLIDTVWSADEVERFLRLVVWAPQLLSHDEACAWAVIDAADEDSFFTYWYNSKDMLVSVKPRFKVIKMAWPLILERAERVKKEGMAKPLSQAEVEAFIGRSVDSVKESERTPQWQRALDEPNWLSRWDEKDVDDLRNQLDVQSADFGKFS